MQVASKTADPWVPKGSIATKAMALRPILGEGARHPGGVEGHGTQQGDGPANWETLISSGKVTRREGTGTGIDQDPDGRAGADSGAGQ